MATEVVTQAARVAYEAGQRDSPHIKIEAVTATRSKQVRVEPLALRYEKREVWHAHGLKALEAELCDFSHSWDRVRDGSPNRVDALVWATVKLLRQPKTLAIA